MTGKVAVVTLILHSGYDITVKPFLPQKARVKKLNLNEGTLQFGNSIVDG